jgi:hypothetical protein
MLLWECEALTLIHMHTYASELLGGGDCRNQPHIQLKGDIKQLWVESGV